MTIELTRATFVDRVGETFTLSREGFPTLSMKLDDAADLRRPDQKIPEHVRQDPFQLTLLGPASPMLDQGPYSLHNDTLGEFQLFVVPGGPRGEHQVYYITVN